ncbi:hypothetical protein CUMW_122730, partial [Citrus unshiu]
ACCFNGEGLRYQCSYCRSDYKHEIDLHPECRFLKASIKYKGHQHLLTFVENVSFKSECQVCSCEIQGTVFAHCVECRLDFHFQCDGLLHLPATIVHENGDGHDPLILNIETSSIKDDTKLLLHCDVCKKERDPVHPYYCCAESEYHAHCLIKFEIHMHDLAFFEKLYDNPKCTASCNFTSPDHAAYFRCVRCNFNVHVLCPQLSSKTGDEGAPAGGEIKVREIEHCVLHQHPLTLCEINGEGELFCPRCGDPFLDQSYNCKRCQFCPQRCSVCMTTPSGNCEACGLDILGDFFARCVKCDINYHIQCGDPVSLPPTVVYEHHEHPLVLTETLAEDDSTLFYCYACVKERNPKHSFYFCAKCEYSTHVHCVITKVQLVERKKLKHFSHQHFLILQENGDVCYSACENFIQGASYGCDPCNYYLHQFCAALPKTLLHPYHQHHLPLQKPFVGIYRQCSACHKHGNGYMFSCVNCKFNLDVDCISLQRPSMKIESHEHIVTIFKKLHRSPKCICCNSASSNIIYLCCMRCNYIVHLWCAPLPKIIKHESHHYPLFITDYLFDKAYDEEVCDICEETRDQEECVYYCADCDFVAEFNCVLSKVRGTKPCFITV